MNRIKSIGVLTSGGDAPGMNAAIRAVVRTGIQRGLRVFGIRHGFSGLIYGDLTEMEAFSVSNIIQRGGTILKTARSREFLTTEGRAKAAVSLNQAGIDALVLLGGNGTFAGGCAFSREHGIPVAGCPATIDNDLYGTDYTIGYDTAVNTAIYNIDKIRDTADALERTFYIEVMGRSSGFIALDVGLSCGAEYISIPESTTQIPTLLRLFEEQRASKRSNIIIVAEGDEAGGALALAQKIKDINGVDFRVTILGHIQRGGSPSARDRILASRLGAAAVDTLLQGKSCVMLGEIGGKVVEIDLNESWQRSKSIDTALLGLSYLLAT